MRSLWDDQARAEIVARIGNLKPDNERQWGRMDCPTMVGHLANGLRMVLGERDLGPPRGPYRFAPVRYLMIHVVPWPKGKAKAPQEPQLKSAEEWAAERDDLLALIDRAARTPSDGFGKTHFLFGQMSHRDWGVLAYRHLDHHLTQFSA